MNATRRNDFPDWLPPVLVKELRQGMRTSFFTGIFVTLQLLLAVTMSAAMATDANNSIGSAISQILFAVFAFAVLLVQPLRLVNTLVSDVKSGTMETMSMARQSAMRIVLGKWFAIAGQTTLLFFTFLPYLLLRYFLGGMNLVQESLFLTILFIASLVFSAMTLGLSACKSPFVRYGMPVLIFPIAGFILWFMMLPASFSGHIANPFSLAGDIPWLLLGVASGLMLYYGYSLLSMGASIISTPAENRVALRRIIPVCFLVAMFWIELPNFMGFSMHYLLCSLVACPALILALTETTPPVKSSEARFSRYGVVGKPAGIFLMPTRSSGLFFAVCLFGLLLALILTDLEHPWASPDSKAERFMGMVAIPATLLFAAVCQSLLPRVFRPGLNGYLKLVIGSLVGSLVLDMMPGVHGNRGAVGWMLCWHPLGASILPTHIECATVLAVLIPVYLVILLAAAVILRKNERPLGGEAETMTDS